MRKWLVVVMMMGFVGLFGCSNAEYDQAMADGQAALEEADYEAAVEAFERALEEKADDEEAKTLRAQTEMVMEASEQLTAGALDEALALIESVIEEDHGSDLLIEHAEEMQDEIETLQTQQKEYAAAFEEAEKALAKEEFDEAAAAIEVLLKEDLSHAVFNDIQENSEKLQASIKEQKAEVERLAKEEARKKKESEEKRKKEAEEKARAEAEAKKQKEAEEKKRKEAEAKAAAAKKKEQQGIDIEAFTGYWLNPTNDLAIHVAPTYISSAVPYSDVMSNDAISSVSSVSQNEIQVKFTNGHTSKLKLSGDKSTMSIFGESYRRVSKEEANAIFDGYYELP
ncbi:Transcriptional regulator ICP22 like protein [Lentibacillus sp. JNUCC-1]|uniref:hypothetical protein n=1 Tax=Lentibacillus sp. JNUCC-1 TaxID=2654513 RepID=UPI0012E917B6|nr:hypothetical protein [Lentibacillus sp. JNUCC-1]MUV36991.1 Transcriptional regulator ICP22 like protein [Lentibacillus sp. JNUCC-1]